MIYGPTDVSAALSVLLLGFDMGVLRDADPLCLLDRALSSIVMHEVKALGGIFMPARMLLNKCLVCSFGA